MGETESELWISEDELVKHYQDEENYQRLQRGEVGGNLIYKYKSQNIVFEAEAWIDFLSVELNALATERLQNDVQKDVPAEISALAVFCRARMKGLLDVEGDTSPLTPVLDHDVPAWLRAPEGSKLRDFRLSNPRVYKFYYTEEQLQTRDDLFRRYGTTVNALSKIVTRVSNLESLYRKVDAADGTQELFTDSEVDGFTRYTLAG
jgi:hypothetical protein